MIKERRYIISGAILIIAFILISRCFYLQILDTELKEKAELRTVKRIVLVPDRGSIYDRKGREIVINTPVHDLMVTIKDAKNNPLKDTLEFCNKLGITKEEFKKRIAKIMAKKPSEGYSPILPQKFIEQFPNEDYHRIVDIFQYPGFEFVQKTIRKYPHKTLANALGYVAQVSKAEIQNDPTRYYSRLDDIGKSGIEKYHEELLRGEKGAKYVVNNASGVEKKPYKEKKYDIPAIAGTDLITSIDLDLQLYATKLMEGKKGSVVAIEPATGEILAIVSSPSYDPNMLAGRAFSENYLKLVRDSTVPLYDRATQAPYPPGSTFKTVCALVSLQLDVIEPLQKVYCGDEPVADHAPPGSYNIIDAIRLSSNKYFSKIFRWTIQQKTKEDWYEDSQYGLDIWRDYVQSFDIGRRTESDFPQEVAGFVPGSKYYNRIWPNTKWNGETIFSLGIGQGEMSITPLQMANFCSIIANKGYSYPPHMAKGIKTGSEDYEKINYKKDVVNVSKEYFDIVTEAMNLVVNDGTASLARIDSIEVCGKTGTAQNPHGEDHSLFIGFAPMESPKIAVAVIVENSGFGGTWAAPIASLVMEMHIKNEISNLWKEKRILEFKK